MIAKRAVRYPLTGAVMLAAKPRVYAVVNCRMNSVQLGRRLRLDPNNAGNGIYEAQPAEVDDNATLFPENGIQVFARNLRVDIVINA